MCFALLIGLGAVICQVDHVLLILIFSSRVVIRAGDYLDVPPGRFIVRGENAKPDAHAMPSALRECQVHALTYFRCSVLHTPISCASSDLPLGMPCRLPLPGSLCCAGSEAVLESSRSKTLQDPNFLQRYASYGLSPNLVFHSNLGFLQIVVCVCNICSNNSNSSRRPEI